MEKITQSDWSAVCSQNEVDGAYDNFINIIEESYERSFPLQKVSRKRFKDKPRITSALKKSSIPIKDDTVAEN